MKTNHSLSRWHATAYAFLFLLLFCTPAARALNIYEWNTSNGDVSDPNNWLRTTDVLGDPPDPVPDSDDVAIISPGFAITVTGNLNVLGASIDQDVTMSGTVTAGSNVDAFGATFLSNVTAGHVLARSNTIFSGAVVTSGGAQNSGIEFVAEGFPTNAQTVVNSASFGAGSSLTTTAGAVGIGAVSFGDGGLIFSGGATATVNAGTVPVNLGFAGSDLPASTAVFMFRNTALNLSGIGTQFTANGDLVVGIGFGDSKPAAINITGGANLITNGKSTFGTFLRGDPNPRTNGSGTLTVDGGGSTWQADGDIILGAASTADAAGVATGQVAVLNGGRIDATGQKIILGKEAGSEGTLNVRNANSTALSKDITIGSLGTGTLLVEDTGMLHNTGNVIVGDMGGSNGTATITGTGSKWQVDGNLTIGAAASSQGNLTVASGGGLRVNGATSTVTLGRDANSNGTLNVRNPNSSAVFTDITIGSLGTGTVIVGDNGLLHNTGNAVVGDMGGGNGTGTITGMGSKWQVDGNLTIGAAASSQGNLTVASGGGLTVNGTTSSVTLGRDANSNGTLNVLNPNSSALFKSITIGSLGKGTMVIGDNGSVHNSGAAILGELAMSNGTATITDMGSKWQVDTNLTIGSLGIGALNIESQGFVQTSSDAILGKQAGGNGTATVTGAGSKWQVDGSLIVGLAGESDPMGMKGTGQVTVKNGGELVVNGGVTLGQEVGGQGTLTLDNAASRFTCSGALLIGVFGTGTVNVESGFNLNRSAQDVRLGENDGSFGTLNVRNADTTAVFKNATIGSRGAGTVLVEDTGLLHNIGNAILGEMAGGNGAATITGIGTQWKVDGNLVVGLAGDTLGGKGIGHVVVMNGAELVVNGQFLTLGQEFGSEGTLTLDGVGSKASGLASLQIGRHGDGTFEVINGASSILSSTILGIQDDGSGTIRVAGKGPNGGPASMVTTQGSLTVGGASTGTLLVTNGGQMITDQGAAIIGRDANVVGNVTLMGQDSQWTINGPGSTSFSPVPGNLAVAQGGIASFTISDHANFTAGSVVVGQNANSNGTLTLTGSGGTNDSMMTANSLTVGDGGIGLLSVSKGAKLNVGATIIGDQSNSFGTLKVTGTGPEDTATRVTVTSLSVGRSGHGELVVGNGAVFQDTGGLFAINGSNSSVTVDGLGSAMGADAANVDLGQSSTATLTISNQGFLRTAGGFIRNGSTVKVNDANSEWQVGSNGLHVGAVGNGFLIINGGRVRADGPVILGDTDFGQMLVENKGSLTVTGPNSIIIGNGAIAQLNMYTGSQVSAAGVVIGKSSNLNLFEAGAQLTVNNALSVGRSASDTGTLTVDNGHVSASLLALSKGSNVSVTGGSIDLGTTLGQAAAGQIQVGFGGTLKDNGAVTANVVNVLNLGTVGGSGTINGKLINGGKVAPGDPQTLTVNGDYQQLNGGLLQIAIAGKTMPEFDHLNVTGHIALDMGAKLELDFINGFAPKTGDKFDFLQSGDPLITDNFSEVIITGLEAGFQFVLAPDGVGSYGLVALNDGVSTTVPEPSVANLVLFSVLVAVAFSARRKFRAH